MSVAQFNAILLSPKTCRYLDVRQSLTSSLQNKIGATFGAMVRISDGAIGRPSWYFGRVVYIRLYS